jgi:hypothetical protein
MKKLTLTLLVIVAAAFAAYFFYNPVSKVPERPEDQSLQLVNPASADVPVASEIAATAPVSGAECSVEQTENNEASLRKLKQEELVVRADMFRFIKDLPVKPYQKEQVLQSLGQGFSIEDYRKQMSWHKDFYFSDLPPVEGKLDIIPVSDSLRFSLLLKDQQWPEILQFVKDKNMTSQTVVDGLSVLSTILAVQPQLDIGWLKSFIELGLQPTTADVRAAIDSGYSAAVLVFLTEKLATTKDKVWYQQYAKFNLLTYAASKRHYEFALHLHTSYGIALFVEHDYTVLDFIDYSTASDDPYVTQLIEIALKQQVQPLRLESGPAIHSYLSQQGLDQLAEQASYLLQNEWKMSLNDMEEAKLSAEQKLRFQQLTERLALLQRKITDLTDAVKHCALKPAEADDAKTAASPASPTTDVRTSQNRHAVSDLIRQVTPEQAQLMIEMAEATDEANRGHYEQALAMIDGLVNKTGDKELYSGFISIAVNANYPITVIDKALNQGGKLSKNAIFSFITNGNLEGIELYKRHHSISAARSVRGQTPLAFALQLKAKEEVLAKLKE